MMEKQMNEKPLFELQDLTVEIENRRVLQGINLKIFPGEVHVLMGRNGAGKSTLALTLMGHPKYRVQSGKILLQGEDLVPLPPEERAKRRLFLGFQYPVAIPGVTVANFLRSSLRAVRGAEVPVKQVRSLIKRELEILQIPESFMTRFLNEGFSGGEKKRLEILQMSLLEPKLAVLDEADSGLDVDALKLVALGIEQQRIANRGLLLITHYQRLLNYIQPSQVHVLVDGKIVKSGGPGLALELEEKGYDWLHAVNPVSQPPHSTAREVGVQNG